MELKLPPEVLKGLPEPDSSGIIRVTAGLKVSPDGEASLVEMNDMPVDVGDDESKETPDDEKAEGDDSMPDLGAMADEVYGRK